MDKNKLLDLLFKPEEKHWTRVFDAGAVLMAFAGIVIIFFNLPSNADNVILRFGLWLSVFSLPVLAYALFRKSTLFKLERLAILSLALSSAFGFLVATIELTKALHLDS